MREARISFSLNNFQLVLAAVFLCMGALLEWQHIRTNEANQAQQEDYEQALAAYESVNIYYNPAAVVAWLTSRQNPAGYFVPNPDLLFEPSQLNSNSLRATRYAVLTLRELDALHLVNRHSIIEFVMALYVPNLSESDATLDPDVPIRGPFAAFKTTLGGSPGVRPTMDALLTLAALQALGDARLKLNRVRNYILAHQNQDGGFWDSHYPRYRKSSSMKCTSFALRGLKVIQHHLNEAFDPSFTEKTVRYIDSSLDDSAGGYSDQPGLPAQDSYDTFRAFITLWSLKDGSDTDRSGFVSSHMDIDRTIGYFFDAYYYPDVGAFSRFNRLEKRKPSLKATHLIIWLIVRLQRESLLDIPSIARYVLQNENKPGEYGGDIYSTYSATGILKKLAVRETSLSPPVAPTRDIFPYPWFLSYSFFVLGLITLAFSYLSKKKELQAINNALQAQATIDALTGIYNRQKSDEFLNIEVKKSERYEGVFSVILFDVDYFKDINDDYGHLVGDEVLKRLTQIVSEHIRESDHFARWGGEEFLVISTQTMKEGALIEAEKIRNAIAHATFGEVGHIYCSFGVSEYQEKDTAASIIKRADKALYSAKESGRNRVCSV